MPRWAKGNSVVTMTSFQRKELFVTQANDTYDACVWSKKIGACLSGVASTRCPLQLFGIFALAGALGQDG